MKVRIEVSIKKDECNILTGEYYCLCWLVFTCNNVREKDQTSSPTAWSWKQSEQDMSASRTPSPNFSKASRIRTSNPGEFLSKNTFIRKPLSTLSTFTTCAHVQNCFN